MTTDITIEEPAGATSPTFDTFARDELPLLARAVAVVGGPGPHPSSALDTATRSAYEQWNDLGNEAAQHVYATAVHELVGLGKTQEAADRSAGQETPSGSGTTSGETLDTACVVAFYGLDWPVATIATAFNREPDHVIAVLDLASTEHAAGGQLADLPGGATDGLRSFIKEQIAHAHIALPDTTALGRADASARRRTRLILGGTCVVVLLAILLALGQFGTRRDRAEPTTSPTAPPAALPAPPAAAATPGQPRLTPPPSAATVTALEQQALDAASAVTALPPDLIADDGRGGFVGVRADRDSEPAGIIVGSPTGSDWLEIGELNLAPSMTIDRFERSGDRFVAWLSGVTPSSDEVIGTIAVTSDFEQWSFVEVAVDEPAPRGLDYDFEIVDVAFLDGTIIALVITTFEVNFPELQLIESNTCGHSIEPEVVVVKLCNGGEIDVLSVSGIDRLPPSTRIYTGTEGFSLEEVALPGSAATAPTELQDATDLIPTDGAVLLVNETGAWIASSVDGQTWVKPTTSLLPGVMAAATSSTGQVVSAGVEPAPLLNSTIGGQTLSQSLSTLIPSIPSALGDDPLQLVLGESDGTWVAWVAYEGEAWVLSSPDGQDWQPRPASRMSVETPTLFVGSEQAIVQWRFPSRSITMVVDFR